MDFTFSLGFEPMRSSTVCTPVSETEATVTDISDIKYMNADSGFVENKKSRHPQLSHVRVIGLDNVLERLNV